MNKKIVHMILSGILLAGTLGFGILPPSPVSAADLTTGFSTDSPQCYCNDIQFTDTTSGGTLPYTYSWDFGDGTGTSTDQNPSYHYDSDGTYTVTLTVTDADSSTADYTDNVTVDENPTAGFTSNSPQYYPSPIDFTDTTSGGTSSYDYYWDFGDGTGTSTDQNPSYHYDSSGTYNITLTVTDINGCTNDFTDTVTLTCLDCSWNCTAKDTGVIDAWIGDEYGTRVYTCPDQGESVTYFLWVTIDNHTGTDRYQAILIYDVYINGSPAGQYCYCLGLLTATTSDYLASQPITFVCGDYVELIPVVLSWSTTTATCADAADCKNHNPAQCWSNPSLPIMTPLVAWFTADNECFCNSIDFTAEALGGDPPYTYSWDFGDGIGTSTEQNPSYHYDSADTYTVTLTVTDANSTEYEYTDTVTVHENPTAGFTSNSPQCYCNDIQFTDTTSGGTPPYTYSWDFGDGTGTSTDQNPSYHYDSDGTYTVELIVTDDNGCTGSYTSTATVNPNPLVTVDDEPICAGQTATLTADTTGSPCTVTRWQWYTGTSAVPANIITDATSSTYQTSIAGDYTCEVECATGCTAEDYGTVTINPSPTADFTANPTSGCGPTLDVQFTDTSTGNPTSWSWVFGDGGTSALQNPSHQYTSSGNYTVTLTVTNACGSDSETKTNYITVYANPTADAGTDQQSCEDYDGTTTFSLSGGASGGSGSGYTYSWSTSDSNVNIVSPSSQNTDVDIAGTGPLTITLTVTDSNGCQGSDNIILTVNPNPDCTITAPNVCENTTLNTASVPASSGATYAWTVGGNGTLTGGQGTNSIEWSAGSAGTATIDVTVTNANNCECTATQKSVTINAKPDCTITAPAAVCEGATALSASVPASSGATYAWSVKSGDATIDSGDTTKAITWHPTGTSNVTLEVTVTTAAGCSKTCEKTITVDTTGSIGDLVWADANQYGIKDTGEDGIANITVTLLDASDLSEIAATETDANGYYLFPNLEAGDYIVDVDEKDVDMPADYFSTTRNDLMNVSLAPCEDFLDADFGYYLYPDELGIIGAFVWDDANGNEVYDEGETGIPWITVLLKTENGDTLLNSTETDFYGNYFFFDNPKGFYTVEIDLNDPDLAGYTATTPTSVIVVIASNFLDANFGFSKTSPPPPPPPTPPGGGSVCGTCFLDVDMLGEITTVKLDCCNNKSRYDYLATDPDSYHFLNIGRYTEIICGDCVGSGSYPILIEMVVAEGEQPPVPDGWARVGPVYDFIGSQGNRICSAVTFGKPVVVLLNYDPAYLPQGAFNPSVARYNKDENLWQVLPPDVGRIAEVGVANGLTTQFSSFAIMVELPGESPPPATTAASPPTEPAPSPAHFLIGDLSIVPSQVRTGIGNAFTFMFRKGGNVSITADVSNDGGQGGSYTAALKLNGEVLSSKDIALQPGQSQQVIFTVTEIEPGQYVVQIGDLSGEFETLTWTNWWLIGGIIAGITLLAWYFGYYRRRHLRPPG